MAINIMKELQERMRKIEYVTMDSIEMVKLFNSKNISEYDSERIDKIAQDVEEILKKLCSETDYRRNAEELPGNEELLCTLADICGLIYQMKSTMVSSTGKQLKNQSSKTVDTIMASIEDILHKKGITINNSDNDEDFSFDGISYKGRTVKYSKSDM